MWRIEYGWRVHLVPHKARTGHYASIVAKFVLSRLTAPAACRSENTNGQVSTIDYPTSTSSTIIQIVIF